MTFDQLFRYSEPKRIKRSDTVRGPPLEINSNSDAVYHAFNFKSFPSTTGLRHHGYIKFLRPEGNQRKQLQHIPCVVDCTCPDYKYQWAWANKQRGASKVGPQSMNQAWNKAPRIKNPSNIPGLCKHLLACRDYIYGMLAKFPGTEPDDGEKLAQLVKYGKMRWDRFDTLMAKAKDQEKWYAAVKQAVNQGRAGDLDLIYDLYHAKGGKNLGIPAGIPARGAVRRDRLEPPGEEPPPLPQPLPRPPQGGPVLPQAGRPAVVPPAPAPAPALAVPPGERGRQLQPAPPKLPTSRVQKPVLPVKPIKNNLPIGKKSQKPIGPETPPGKRGPLKRPPRKESQEDFLLARVDRLNGSSDGANNSMSILNEAIKLVEEVEQDEILAPSEIAGEMATDTVDAPPPSEPPVSDDAIGADTEGNVVLTLLGQIKDLLARLVGAEEGEGEGEFGPSGEMPPGAEDGMEFPPEEGEDIPVDALPEPDEEEDEEEDDEDGMPPRPAPEGVE